jgi:co-chaperonin GroES (HSP10)
VEYPKPQGYKILVRMHMLPEKTSGGIYLPENDKALHDTASIVAQVIAIGPDAYKNEGKFDQPWCKVGDYIMLRTFSGTRFKIGGEEFRLVNDDAVEAVVDDPNTVERL